MGFLSCTKGDIIKYIIKQLDLNTLTPIEALMKLNEIKKILLKK